jgi:hypothetical protein
VNKSLNDAHDGIAFLRRQVQNENPAELPLPVAANGHSLLVRLTWRSQKVGSFSVVHDSLTTTANLENQYERSLDQHGKTQILRWQ